MKTREKKHVLPNVDCETCETTGQVLTINKWYVDRGTKWQRYNEEHIKGECPDCNGLGFYREEIL